MKRFLLLLLAVSSLVIGYAAGSTNAPPAASTNTPPKLLSAATNAPTFADGVLIAGAMAREGKGVYALLSPGEQVALCLRVWQQQRGGGKSLKLDPRGRAAVASPP